MQEFTCINSVAIKRRVTLLSCFSSIKINGRDTLTKDPGLALLKGEVWNSVSNSSGTARRTALAVVSSRLQSRWFLEKKMPNPSYSASPKP